jgi:hypothetical protein
MFSFASLVQHKILWIDWGLFEGEDITTLLHMTNVNVEGDKICKPLSQGVKDKNDEINS